MHWPELVRRSEKCAGPAGQCLCRGLHSTARPFADDCKTIIYRPIRNNNDTIILQNDLNKILAELEFMWQMQFNIDKCFILREGRPKHKLLNVYTLHNQNLSERDSAKYLGVTITSDLQ